MKSNIPAQVCASSSRIYAAERLRSAESFGRHISLLLVPAGDAFAALVQTANSLEAATVAGGLSTRMTAEEQAFYAGQSWDALPGPKRQFTFYVVMPDGVAKSFHIGPHAPALRPQDIELVHQLWLKFRRDPSMQDLHHGNIVTYALHRPAAEHGAGPQKRNSWTLPFC